MSSTRKKQRPIRNLSNIFKKLTIKTSNIKTVISQFEKLTVNAAGAL